MSDHEHAEAALAALEQIDDPDHNEDIRDAHKNAVAAVTELADLLTSKEREESEVEAPNGWDDEDEWEDRLEEARENGDVPSGKGTLTTKTIDERQYYYLQWREGEQVKSQYVAPVSPS